MLLTLLSLLVPVLLVASVWLWLRALRRVSTGRPILDLVPRRPVPWDVVDLVLALFLAAAIQSLALLALRTFGPAAEYLAADPPVPMEQWSVAARGSVLFATSAGNLLAMLGSVVLIHLRTGAGWRDLGLVGHRLLADIKLGAAAFAMLAPPVYLVQLILVQLVPSKHPLIELLKRDPNPWFFVLSGFSAVLVAPLVEEYLFRLLLQGWLEKVAAYRGRAGWILTTADFVRPWPAGSDAERREAEDAGGQPERNRGPRSRNVNDAETAAQAGQDRTEPGNRSEPGNRTEPGNRSEIGPSSEPAPVIFWPILVSSAVFSLLHYQHGPDWIPLFLLALGLGYLYWRTHRIVASIMVHFLLNGLTLLALMAEILESAS